jgi:SNF2 family DNA or RNA helicase
LDIIQIVFENIYNLVDCLRYNGRKTPEKHTIILQDFEKTTRVKILLISRAAGGVGLNITTVNIIILCGL